MCDGLVEAAWLAAVAAVPLFLNKYASNSFEPEKIYLARGLALVVLGAWLVRYAATSSGHDASSLGATLRAVVRSPLPAAIVAYTFVSTLSTFTSLDPSQSFWGGYGRAMGLYTQLSSLVLGVAAAVHLRTRPQIDRLVAAIVLGSVPVSVYAIGQGFDVEPILVAARIVEASRVSSTFGSPVFLAGYLVVVLPVALGRMALLVKQVIAQPSLRGQWLDLGAYGMVAVLASVAIVLTGSRGALLGLVAGLCVMTVALAAQVMARRTLAGLVAIGGLLAVGAVFVGLTAVTPERLARSPRLTRFSELLATDRGAGLQRALLWQMAAEAVTARQVLLPEDEPADPWRHLRGLVGYGPETIEIATRQFIPVALTAEYGGRNLAPDRSHSQSWDLVITRGMAGLVTWECIYALALWYGLQFLGLLPVSGPRFRYSVAFLGCGLACGAGAAISLGLPFLWLGFRFGTTLGLLLLCITGAGRSRPVPKRNSDEAGAILVASLCGGFVGHAIEVAFSFPTAATDTLLALQLGLLVAVRNSGFLPLPAPATHLRTTVLTGGLLGALMVGTLGFALLSKGGASDPVAILRATLAHLPGSGQPQEPWVALGLLATGTLFSAAWSVIAGPGFRLRTAGSVAVIATSLGGALWIGIAFHLAGMPALETVHEAGTAIGGHLRLEATYYVFTAAILLLMGRTAGPRPIVTPAGAVAPRRAAVVIAASLACAAVVYGTYSTAMRLSYADIASARASALKATGQWPVVSALYELAARESPATAFYREAHGNALLQHALVTRDAHEQVSLFDRAAHTLEQGRRAFPVQPGFDVTLGDVWLQRALREQDGEPSQTHATYARRHLQRALLLEPADPDTWLKAAYLDLAFFNDSQAAVVKVERSLRLRPHSGDALALLGDARSAMAARESDPGRREQLVVDAIRDYERAVAADGGKYRYFLSLARAHHRVGHSRQALEAYLGALQRAPDDQRAAIEPYVDSLRAELDAGHLAPAQAPRRPR